MTDLDDYRWASFEEDSRSGVQTAIKQRRKAILAEIAEEERLEMMLNYEKSLYAQGVELIAGVDEVGRGPLAGPVVAAAVILPKLCKIKGLNDSKKIPKSKHEAIYNQVMKEAIAVGIGNYILGIQPTLDGLKVDPCIPHTLSGFTVTRRFRGAVYHITVDNAAGVQHGIKAVTVDGKAISGNVLPLAAAGTEVTVQVTMG